MPLQNSPGGRLRNHDGPWHGLQQGVRIRLFIQELQQAVDAFLALCNLFQSLQEALHPALVPDKVDMIGPFTCAPVVIALSVMKPLPKFTQRFNAPGNPTVRIHSWPTHWRNVPQNLLSADLFLQNFPKLASISLLWS